MGRLSAKAVGARQSINEWVVSEMGWLFHKENFKSFLNN